MRGTRRIAVLAAVATALAPKAGPPRAIPFGDAHPQAQQLFCLVNSERAANGLGSVGWHDQLAGLAQERTSPTDRRRNPAAGSDRT